MSSIHLRRIGVTAEVVAALSASLFATVVVVAGAGCEGHQAVELPPAETCNGPGPCTPASATDGLKDADETDVDCGGSQSAKCPDSAICVIDLNCLSGNCEGGTCAASLSETEDAGSGAPPDCTIDNTCAPAGATTGSAEPGCAPGSSSASSGGTNDPSLCAPTIP